MATRFLDLILDGEARTLTRGTTRLHLSPKALDLLLLLIRERPRAMPKAELLDRVWPGTFGDEPTRRTITAVFTRRSPAIRRSASPFVASRCAGDGTLHARRPR